MTTEMRKEELLKAAEQLKWGITAYVDAITALQIDMIPVMAMIEVGKIADDVADDAAKIKPMATEKKSAKSKKAPAKKEEIVEDTAEDDTEESVSYTKEDLDQMTFNDLRKLAKELGLKVKGDRETIAKAILASNATAESEDGEVEEKPSKTKKAPAKRVAIPKEEDEEVEDDADEDDVDNIDEVTQNVLDIVEDMETSEIADILSDAGLSPKGKRQALIDKVIKAVKDGTISIDDEDDGEDIEEDVEEDEDIVEDTEDEAEDFGPNDFDNPNMTDERREALEALDGQLRKDYKAKKIKLVTMKKELKAFYDGDDEALEAIAEMKSDEILDNYIDMKQLFIGDDGEENETESPYSVNGEYYCCGMPLTYNEDDNTFICEVCGSEYNADE